MNHHLVFFFVLFFVSTSKVQAFTGTYGINYGRVADNIPPPGQVVTLLKAAKIRNVRIYDADHSVIKAFNGSGLNLVIGLPNQLLTDLSDNKDHAMTWVKQNVQAFFPETPIRGIAIGNEVLGVEGTDLCASLLGAAKNIHNALEKIGLADAVQVSTSHSQAVFDNSFPPSACVFRDNVAQYMKPLLEFFSMIGSPFCLNAYPFLAYMSDPETMNMNYALFEPNKGVFDEKSKLHYDNMRDAQVDAAYAALEDAGFGKMEVIVTETGWASRGDEDQAAATVRNAKTYNYNLHKRLAKRKGTPLRPKAILKAYVFAIFDEDLKPGPTSERNFGLFKADGSVSYNVGFLGLESSSAGSYLRPLKGIQNGVLCGSYGMVFTATAVTLFLLFRF